MDANGTRFHLLLGTRDWLDRTDAGRPRLSLPAGADAEGVHWDDTRQELTLFPLPFQFKSAKNDRAPSLSNRRGAARDRYGNWYWIDMSATAIAVRSAGSGVTSRFWTVGDGAAAAAEPRAGDFVPVAAPTPPVPLLLAGLTITEDHYLVAGVVEPAGLLIFDLHASGAPRHVCWPAGVDFSPFDLTPRCGGGAWVLDRDHARIWTIDRRFAIVRRVAPPGHVPPSGEFHDTAGTTVGALGGPDPLAPIRVEDAWPAPADAVAIEATPGGGLLVMDRPANGSSSTIFYFATIDGPRQTLTFRNFALAGHDFAFVKPPAGAPKEQFGRLFVVDSAGNQSYAFALQVAGNGTLSSPLDPIPQYFPMQVFGGKALVTAGCQPYYDFEQTWIPLVDQKRPRHLERGEVHIMPLDGREADCVWHRLLIDACIPPETTVEVRSRAANTRDQLRRADWYIEPRPYARSSGSELPFAPELDVLGAGTWELLFQQARGRFLELQIRLSGNGRSTPRLRAIRVYYPRFSYLTRYLPAVYREDRTSASFLERYLANTEGTLTAIEDRIAAAQALLDVRSAPADVLDWLASWLGLVLDPLWIEAKRRLLITYAMDFFARRGTVRGLQTALALTLFDCATPALFTDTDSPRSLAASIRIVEKFRTRQAPPVSLGDPTGRIGPRIGVQQDTWTPAQGRDALLQRYVSVLTSAQLDTKAAAAFPLAAPADASAANIWRQVAEAALGFVPAIGVADPGMWSEFLARRYHGVSSFNEVYGRTGSAKIRRFEDVAVPAMAPPDGAPLVDWHDFETIVLAMAASAHQFTVLIPMKPSAAADSAEHQVRLELARRIVALEKPAHTTFDVRFYWSLFRVGEARLGLDTLIDRGSRAPELMPPLVLDQGHLAESYLAPSYPQNITDRRLVVGRDRPGDCPC